MNAHQKHEKALSQGKFKVDNRVTHVATGKKGRVFATSGARIMVMFDDGKDVFLPESEFVSSPRD